MHLYHLSKPTYAPTENTLVVSKSIDNAVILLLNQNKYIEGVYLPNAFDVPSQLIADCPRQLIGRQRKITERPISAALNPVLAKVVAPVIAKVVAPVIAKVIVPVIAKVAPVMAKVAPVMAKVAPVMAKVAPVMAKVVAPVIAKVVGPATAARAIEVGKSWAFTEHRSLAVIWALSDPSVEGFVMSKFALEIVRMANVIIRQGDNGKLDGLSNS